MTPDPSYDWEGEKKERGEKNKLENGEDEINNDQQLAQRALL